MLHRIAFPNRTQSQRRSLSAKAQAVFEPLEQRQLLSAVDLAISSFAVTPGPIVAGGTMKVTRTYQVSGANSPTCYLMYRFSTNRIWGDSDDIVFNTRELLSTSASQSLGAHTATVTLGVPTSAVAGPYYLMAKVDASNMVTETDERNNVLMSLVTVSPPANDAFASRIAISGISATVYGVNYNATFETGEPYHGGFVGGKSVWWTWTAPASGTVTIDTIGSSFDTLLGAYVGTSVSKLIYVGRNNNISSTNLASSTSFSATYGQTYQIAVDGYHGATGAIKLNLKQTLSVPAASTSVFATKTYNDKVMVSWTPVAGATGYEVWRTTGSTLSGAVKISPAADVKTNTFSDTTAVTGTKYWYWVRSKNLTVGGKFGPGAQGVRVPAFTSNSGNATNAPYLHTAPGTVRTYIGQGDRAGLTATLSVTTQTLLGVNCAYVALTTSSGNYSHYLWLAGDANGKLWVFKEVENGTTAFQAASLADLAPASTYSSIQVRLITGAYAVGTKVTEADGRVAEITSLTETSSKAPGYTFVAVKYSQPDGSDVTWRYFTESLGLAAEADNADGDVNVSGWALEQFT